MPGSVPCAGDSSVNKQTNKLQLAEIDILVEKEKQ